MTLSGTPTGVSSTDAAVCVCGHMADRHDAEGRCTYYFVIEHGAKEWCQCADFTTASSARPEKAVSPSSPVTERDEALIEKVIDSRHTPGSAIESRDGVTFLPGCPGCEALAAFRRLVGDRDRLLAERNELAAVRRRVPGDEGGPGREETYWLRAKANAAITHLRDVEDYARLCGGLPEGFNALRADRARQLYEAITADLLNGKRGVATTAERLLSAEVRLRETTDALRAVEWGGNDSTDGSVTCPYCGGWEPNHETGCGLAAALGHTREPGQDKDLGGPDGLDSEGGA